MTAVVSVGSNRGDRLAHLRLAVRVLKPSACSGVWQTAPVGGPPQQDYLNAVLLCPLTAERTWVLAQRAEQLAGRTRSVRWGPRTLDVDIITAPGPVPEELMLPHPRARERAFVLAPWWQVQPAAELDGEPVGTLLAALDTRGVRPTEHRL